MVCDRCIMVVEQTLRHHGIAFEEVALGYVTLKGDLSATDHQTLLPALQKVGFDIIDDKKAKITEKIKALLVDLIQNRDNDIKIKYSQYLADKLHLDYGYLSALFSASEQITIERFIIQTKISKVKEYLTTNQLALKEIAVRLGYSSVQALSNQFHKEMGMSPTDFKGSIRLQQNLH